MYNRDRLKDLLNGKFNEKKCEIEKYNFKGTIMTSYFGKLKDIYNEETIYLVICRFPPKSLKFTDNIIHCPILSPSEDLLLNTKKGIVDEKTYNILYMKELEKYMNEAIHNIAIKINNGIKVCLLCYEKTGDLCHRHILSNYISEKYNIDTMEL